MPDNIGHAKNAQENIPVYCRSCEKVEPPSVKRQKAVLYYALSLNPA